MRKPRRFGPSKARVEAVPGQTEAQVLSIMRSLLGRPRATLQDAANLAGAPDDARVKVTVIPKHGRRIIEIHAESKAVVLRVLLYRGLDGKVILEDDRIDVGEEFQRRGRGASLLGRQVEHAVRLGVAEIRAYAVRDDEMGYVGYWVWALLGFDGPLPVEIRRRLPHDLASARRLSDLMETHRGQYWWHEHGDSVSLVFDLGPKSRGLAAVARLSELEGVAMKRRGIGAAFSDEDLEMLRSLWLERGRREAKAADRSAPPKRAARPRAIEPAPDRRAAAKKKTGKDGAAPSPRD